MVIWSHDSDLCRLRIIEYEMNWRLSNTVIKAGRLRSDRVVLVLEARENETKEKLFLDISHPEFLATNTEGAKRRE